MRPQRLTPQGVSKRSGDVRTLGPRAIARSPITTPSQQHRRNDRKGREGKQTSDRAAVTGRATRSSFAGRQRPAPQHGACSRCAARLDPSHNTLRSAHTQIHQALSERDSRRQHFAGYLGLMALMTMHPLKPGRCLDFIARTYSELLSLHDDHPGENWVPLVAIVRRDPPVTSAVHPHTPRLR